MAMAEPAARSGGQRVRPQRGILFSLWVVSLVLLVTLCFKNGASSGTPEADGSAFLSTKIGVLALPRHFIVERIVQSHFPGAMPGSRVLRKVLKAIKPYGLTTKNTIYGQSICPDEINMDPGHISTLMTAYHGRNFFLGGLGGVPFAGKTGFMAFSAHVPKNGHVFVLFGPHIGFTPKGEPGKFLRHGQDTPSTACGASNAALAQVSSGENFPYDDSDVMQGWLRSKLAPSCRDIMASAHPMIELALRNYNIVEQEIKKIINTNYGPGKLVLLGGIQINMPYPKPGYFFPLHFSVRAQGMKPVDLLSNFGVLRPSF